MRHVKNWKVCLTVILSILLITPGIYARPLTREEIDSEIASDLLYPGSDVRAFLYAMVEAQEAELLETAEQAAATAATPLLINIAGLEVARDLLEERLNAEPWARWGMFGLGLLAGGALGAWIGYVISATKAAEALNGLLASY